MNYSHGDYTQRGTDGNRCDYAAPKGTENNPVEQAMTLFVSWAHANEENYFSDTAKQRLAHYMACGASPEQAVDKLIARFPMY